MNDKKNPDLELGNKSFVFFSIGLVLTLFLVVGAFEMVGYYEIKEKEEKEEVDNTTELEELEEETLEEIPPTEVVPPPPAAVVTYPIIQEVPDEKKVDIIENPIDQDKDDDNSKGDIQDKNEDPGPRPTPPAPPKKEKKVEKVDDNKILDFAQQGAEFVGGQKAWKKYLKKNFKYPKKARRMNIQGKVILQFVVHKDGHITDIKVVRKLGGGCDEEAIRVVKNSPKWKPAKHRGKKVNYRMSLPIVFKLR